MTEKARIQEVMETYCRAETEGDWDTWISLFTEGDDVLHEDPVGVAKRYGPPGLKEIWLMAVKGNVDIRLTDEVIVCGNEAIALMCCEFGPEDARMVIDPIVAHIVFNENGKITSLRAFHNF